MPPERAARPDAASSVAPVASRYERSLRPCLGTTIAPRRRALFRQTLLGVSSVLAGDSQLGHGLLARLDLRLHLGDRPVGLDSCRLALQRLLERDEEVVAVRRGVGRDLAVDLAGDHELDQRLAERLHVEELTLRDRVRDLLRL